MFELIALLGLLFTALPALLAVSFVKDKKSLLSKPFLILIFSAAVISVSLYELTGSRKALDNFKLQKSIQAMGGFDAIVSAIEKRVTAHPEDAQGRMILEKIKKHQQQKNP